MKQQLEQLFVAALAALPEDVLPADQRPAAVPLDRARDASHGDFATNIALRLAKAAGMPPRQLAEAIVAAMPDDALVEKTEIAGPGFINVFVQQAAQFDVLKQIHVAAEQYGQQEAPEACKALVEFVSANPTGPLHVGHGRGAAYGASVANLLEAVGYEVSREYYVNDAGRQMDILAASVWLRYLQGGGAELPFPINGYKGAYVLDIAASLRDEQSERFARSSADVLAGLPEDSEDNKEAYIDAVINNTKQLLGDDYSLLFDAGLNSILAGIRDDLADFGVTFDEWFSERSLGGQVLDAVAELEQAGHVETRDGAKWFKATAFDDDKDRVVVRDNGQTTYFASDIAYHRNKKQRGFDTMVDVWGSDHHGYIARVRAGMQACGLNPDDLEVKLVQFAILYRGEERMQMSTRSGEFVTLADLIKEVGKDAARFFYVLRSNDQHLDFDLELAKSQSNDNPVYYIQYAHARIASVFREAEERGLAYDAGAAAHALGRLGEAQETALVTALARYPEVLALSAKNRAPHTLAHFLRELAQAFHTNYNAHKVLIDDAELRQARMYLASATGQVLRNGLALLGVSAPTRM